MLCLLAATFEAPELAITPVFLVFPAAVPRWSSEEHIGRLGFRVFFTPPFIQFAECQPWMISMSLFGQ